MTINREYANHSEAADRGLLKGIFA